MGYRTHAQSETYALGKTLGACLRPGDTALLVGDLGMGKSVLARGIACALGVDGPMPSPTFTLMQPYAGRVSVNHFDLYRLTDLDEFEAAGLDEFIGGDQVALIEWPLTGLRSAPSVTLTLARGAADDVREIGIAFDGMPDPRRAKLLGAIKPWEVAS